MHLKSPSFERNHAPIWAAIESKIESIDPPRVLEIACGSGQHGATFASKVPHIHWQPTDGSAEAVQSTNAWKETLALGNLAPAVVFDLSAAAPPAALTQERYGAAFVCNFLHMVQLDVVEKTFGHLAALLAPSAPVWVYDCYTYGGEHVSDSNIRFDAWLRERGGAVHAFEAVDARAKRNGFTWQSREDLPANNQLTTWVRNASVST